MPTSAAEQTPTKSPRLMNVHAFLGNRPRSEREVRQNLAKAEVSLSPAMKSLSG